VLIHERKTAFTAVNAPAPAQIKVTVDLAQTKPGLEQSLTRAGLKIISGSGSKQLVGSVAPAQLKQLAQIAEVKSISLNK
jgi:hypothetical protein